VNLSAKGDANAVANSNVVKVAIGRGGENAVAVGPRGSAMLAQAHRVSESEAIWTKKVAVDLAIIEADLVLNAVDGIFQLQDRLLDFSGSSANLDRASVVGMEDINLAVDSSVESEVVVHGAS